jgi:hypothetical protein
VPLSVLDNTLPQIIIECAFQADPYSNSLVWTDITQYVDSLSTGRGRNYELGKTEAGTMSLSLRNLDGRFDPLNTASPYYPYVLPYRPIRVRTVSTVTGDPAGVWTGFVERWPQKWSMNGIYGYLDITAVDGFKTILGYRDFGIQYSAKIVNDYGPFTNTNAYFRFEETTGLFYQYGFVSATYAMTPVGGVTRIPTGVAGASVSFDGSTGYLDCSSGAVQGNGGELWVKINTLPPTEKDAVVLATGTANAGELLMGIASNSQSWADMTPPRTGQTFINPTLLVGYFTPPVNLLTANQASMETDATDWPTAVNCTVASDSSHYTTGSKSVSATLTGAAGTVYSLQSTNVAVTPGATYQASAAFYYGTSGNAPAITVVWYTAAQVLISETAVTTSSGATASWNFRSSSRVTAPANAAFAQLKTRSSSSAVGQSFNIDAVAFYATALTTPITYFAPGDTGTRFSVITHSGGSTVRQSVGPGNVVPGSWYHIAWQPVGVNGVGDIHYVNGVALTRNDPNLSTSQLGTTTIGATKENVGGVVSHAGACQIDEVVTGISNVTAALVMSHYVYGLLVHDFPAQVSGARINAILDSVSWPTGQRSIDTGLSSLLASGSLAGSRALDALQVAADSELGNIFVGSTGNFVFKDRSKRNNASSVATFGDGPGEFPYLGDLVVDFDDTYIFNDVITTQLGSAPPVTSEATDTNSRATYGLRTLSRTLPLSTTAEIAQQTATLLGWYKDPHARLASITIDCRANPANFAPGLNREIGDCVRVNRRPPGAPLVSLLCFVDGVKHNVTPTSWTVTYLLTPVLPNTTY